MKKIVKYLMVFIVLEVVMTLLLYPIKNFNITLLITNIVIIAVFFLKRFADIKRLFVLQKFYVYIIVALLTLCLVVPIQVLGSLLNLPDSLNNFVDTKLNSVTGFLCLCIFGPMMEETIFRGAILNTLLEKYTPWRSIFISSLIFALIHLNLAQFIPSILFGIFIGWIYYRLKDLSICIFCHMLYNSLVYYLCCMSLKGHDSIITNNIYVVLSTSFSVLVFVGLILLILKYDKLDRNMKITKEL
jgi:membrane protease YdiL (CAAX protease family)